MLGRFETTQTAKLKWENLSSLEGQALGSGDYFYLVYIIWLFIATTLINDKLSKYSLGMFEMKHGTINSSLNCLTVIFCSFHICDILFVTMMWFFINPFGQFCFFHLLYCNIHPAIVSSQRLLLASVRPSLRYTTQIAPCFAKSAARCRPSLQLVPCEVSTLSCFHLACVCLPRHWPLWYVRLGGRAERVMWPRTSPVTKADTAAAQPRSFQMSHTLHEVAASWSFKKWQDCKQEQILVGPNQK